MIGNFWRRRNHIRSEIVTILLDEGSLDDHSLAERYVDRYFTFSEWREKVAGEVMSLLPSMAFSGRLQIVTGPWAYSRPRYCLPEP